jgi:tetratricopeptide (TPR) repeat protein
MSKPLSTIFLLVLATSLLAAQQPVQQTLPATNAAGQPQQGPTPRPVPQQATQAVSGSTNIPGQPPQPSAALPAQAQQPPRASAAPLQSQEALQTEVALLREKVESATKKTDWLFYILAVVLGLGTITSFISWMKHEWGDSKRVEQRASEIHALTVRGETASQGRAQEVHQTFLESSKNTLDLVNATLRLAKDASERAAHAVEARAKSNLQKLDIDSKDLVAKVPAQDDRKLVSDPALKATLKSLAQRIEGFEINRLVLPEEMLLPSECLFVRGMNFHLEQQFDDAFDAWKQVTHRNETPPLLRSLAWYWIGYEQNNLGRFDQAGISFQRALDTATGVRKFELHRILIETRFFEEQPAEPLLDSLKALLGSTEQNSDEGIEVVRNRILGTIGNIYLETGNELRRTGQEEASKAEYRRAGQYFEKAVDQDK